MKLLNYNQVEGKNSDEETEKQDMYIKSLDTHEVNAHHMFKKSLKDKG